MSVNSMANAAAARRPDIGAPGTVPKGLNEIAAAATTTPAAAHGIARPPQNPTNQGSKGQLDTAYNVLFGYIPTEVLTLYVAVLAALKKGGPGETPIVTESMWIAFFAFLVATPTVVWLVYSAKIMAAKKTVPYQFRKLPLWEMFAATVAYLAWAFALPQSPFNDFPDWYSPALAGVVVLVASTILGLLAPFFQRPLGDDNAA